jgi:adenylylsulfate kinase
MIHDEKKTVFVRPNIFWHRERVSLVQREAQNNQGSAVLWFTGLSGAGKSTVAHAVEEYLHQQGLRTIVLDGDNLRHGLCGDLGFSEVDRRENIRRIGEVAKLFVEAGVIVLTAVISPFQVDRDRVRNSLPCTDFIEIYCDTPIDICEARDVKGLYKQARNGELTEFTGISSPYEVPASPELILNTGSLSLDNCVQQVIEQLISRNVFKI